MNTKTELHKAIDVLREELKKDKSKGSYYWSWQTNIAMAYQDVAYQYDGSETDHVVSNEAARNFLDTLIG